MLCSLAWLKHEPHKFKTDGSNPSTAIFNMPKRLLRIPLSTLVETIVCVLLNRFDCFIVIEGGTGMGKSTLAIHIARKVKTIFRKLRELDEETVIYYYKKVKEEKGISLEEFVEYLQNLDEKKAYNFKMGHDLIYSQDRMMRFLSSWYRIAIPDEMVNITFNRDFYSEDQKNIIKMINMYRDHFNLILACVPQFQTLDNQIKNLCKIRISIVRRGVAIMQTPVKSIYGRDKWDQATNEKLEREWLIKGIKNPSYARLTTVRGIFKFPSLSPKLERLYQKIKDKQRTIILKKRMGLEGEGDEENESVMDKTVKMLLDGKIRNAQVISGLAIAEGKTPEQFIDAVKRRLKKDGKDHRISQYYWEKKLKKGDEDGAF